ncbi:hypothetical protein A0H81_04661 [Grifola frondosa]|uniref:Uncharacterized protein n=1 Tax=Grifola frondosa TaxID=5627 RepID=A0A1C7MF72_GRIFR|nr:hypothetical protein A0H81_04661 [Grifola frondosa]
MRFSHVPFSGNFCWNEDGYGRFVMLVLRPVNLEEQLEDLIPNKTAVWRRWRETVAQKITDGEKLGFDQVDWKMEDGSLTPEEITLLEVFWLRLREILNDVLSRRVALKLSLTVLDGTVCVNTAFFVRIYTGYCNTYAMPSFCIQFARKNSA